MPYVACDELPTKKVEISDMDLATALFGCWQDLLIYSRSTTSATTNGSKKYHTSYLHSPALHNLMRDQITSIQSLIEFEICSLECWVQVGHF